MHAKLGSSSTATVLLAASLALVLVLVYRMDSRVGLAEARYLPTRSDKSELEALKEIIRGLLLESGTNAARQQQPQSQSQSQPWSSYQHPPARAHPQRRAAELSVSSANGSDEPENFAAGPYETASQLFRQVGLRPDR